MSILRENKNTTEKNTEALLQDNRECGLEVNSEKAKHIVVPHHKNARQNHSLLIDDKS